MSKILRQREGEEVRVPGLVSKNGRLYYQSEVQGQPLRGSLELSDTPRNRIEAKVLIRQIREGARTGDLISFITPLPIEKKSPATNAT